MRLGPTALFGRAAVCVAWATMALAAGPARAASPASAAPVTLEVALVDDPDLPALDDDLVGRALTVAAETFAQRFDVAPPRFHVVARFSLDSFMKRYAKPTSAECAPLFSARYHGGGRDELLAYREAAIRFFERWPLAELASFVPEPRRATITDYGALHAAYVDKYLETIGTLQSLETPTGQRLLGASPSDGRSHAAWSCALAAQRQFDVIVTNAFIVADILTEPHPHAVFGKSKVGGIAAPSPGRAALGGQALVASTFSIDTTLPFLAELGTTTGTATVDERAEVLGAFLLAHEVAHAVFGIPDVFDHPAGCLMTTRPGESYREASRSLREHPGPCPRCRPYVEARGAFDQGRAELARGDSAAATQTLAQAMRLMPKHFHGKKRRLAAILSLAAEANQAAGELGKAKKYAQLAMDTDPSSEEARAVLARLGTKARVEVVSSRRNLRAPTRTGTVAR